MGEGAVMRDPILFIPGLMQDARAFLVAEHIKKFIWITVSVANRWVFVFVF